MSKTQSRVSVIIPTLNEEHYIESLLQDLAKQTKKICEIILVDGESRDATVAIASRFPNVEVLVCPPSVAGQRNFGALRAKGEVLIFFDADVHIQPFFIEKIVSEFKRKKLDIGCPLYMPYNSSLQVWGMFLFYNLMLLASQYIIPAGKGTCIIVKRKIFQNSAGFNPSLKSYEDAEFIRRIAKKHHFGILFEKVYESDRRFKKYGTNKMLLIYTLLGFFFVIKKFDLINKVKYEFGQFKKT